MMIELYFSSSTLTPQVPNLQLAICKLHQSLQELYSDLTCTPIIYKTNFMSYTNIITFRLCMNKEKIN